MHLRNDVIEVLGESDGLEVFLPHRKLTSDDHSAVETEEILGELVDYEIIAESHLAELSVCKEKRIVKKRTVKDDVTVIGDEEATLLRIEFLSSR